MLYHRCAANGTQFRDALNFRPNFHSILLRKKPVVFANGHYTREAPILVEGFHLDLLPIKRGCVVGKPVKRTQKGTHCRWTWQRRQIEPMTKELVYEGAHLLTGWKIIDTASVADQVIDRPRPACRHGRDRLVQQWARTLTLQNFFCNAMYRR